MLMRLFLSCWFFFGVVIGASAQTVVGTGPDTMNIVFQYWNFPVDPDSPDPGTQGSYHWFQFNYNATELPADGWIWEDEFYPVGTLAVYDGLKAFSLLGDVVISFEDDFYASFGYYISDIAYDGKNQSGFEPSTPGYWAFWTGGTAGSPSWDEAEYGISGIALENNLWVGLTFTPFDVFPALPPNPDAIPEPSTFWLVALVLGWIARRNRVQA